MAETSFPAPRSARVKRFIGADMEVASEDVAWTRRPDYSAFESSAGIVLDYEKAGLARSAVIQLSTLTFAEAGREGRGFLKHVTTSIGCPDHEEGHQEDECWKIFYDKVLGDARKRRSEEEATAGRVRDGGQGEPVQRVKSEEGSLIRDADRAGRGEGHDREVVNMHPGLPNQAAGSSAVPHLPKASGELAVMVPPTPLGRADATPREGASTAAEDEEGGAEGEGGQGEGEGEEEGEEGKVEGETVDGNETEEDQLYSESEDGDRAPRDQYGKGGDAASLTSKSPGSSASSSLSSSASTSAAASTTASRSSSSTLSASRASSSEDTYLPPPAAARASPASRGRKATNLAKTTRKRAAMSAQPRANAGKTAGKSLPKKSPREPKSIAQKTGSGGMAPRRAGFDEATVSVQHRAANPTKSVPRSALMTSMDVDAEW